MRVSGGRYCGAINCHNNKRTHPQLTFFTFPKDPERSKKWVANTQRQDLLSKSVDYLHKNLCLCAEHFESRAFMNAAEKKSLVWNAVPTLFKNPNAPSQSKKRTTKTASSCGLLQITEIEGRKTRKRTRDATARSTNSKKRKVDSSGAANSALCKESTLPSEKKSTLEKRQTICSPQTKNAVKTKRNLTAQKDCLTTKASKRKGNESKTTLNEALPVLKKHVLTSLPFEIIKAQVQHKNGAGKRWTNPMLDFCNGLYDKSPAAYRYVGAHLKLPSRKSLHPVLPLHSSDCGISDAIINLLKCKQHERNTLCTLVLGELLIKGHLFYDSKWDKVIMIKNEDVQTESSKNALVVMCQGLTKKFQQPLGYIISEEGVGPVEVLQLLTQSIKSLSDIGLRVIAVISDQGANFSAVSKQLGITQQTPYFIFNGEKVFYLFDPPHLLKSVRNHLMKYEFRWEGKHANWAAIKAVYEEDKHRKFRCVPHMTEGHICLKSSGKKKVKLAAQVLSHSVAAAIETLVVLQRLPSSAMGTADFVDRFDKLFDCCNSSQMYSPKRYRRAMMGKNGQVEAFIRSCLKWLEKVQVVTPTSEMIVSGIKCLEGWKVTLSSLLQLREHMHNEYDVNILFTSRLNQDCLEHLLAL